VHALNVEGASTVTIAADRTRSQKDELRWKVYSHCYCFCCYYYTFAFGILTVAGEIKHYKVNGIKNILDLIFSYIFQKYNWSLNKAMSEGIENFETLQA